MWEGCGAQEHDKPPHFDWVDDLRFDVEGPPWLSMGMSRLEGRGLLPIVDGAFKERLLRERRDEVLVGDDRFLTALERGARRVEDDLCVLVRADGGWILVAGCVCSPSHWVLAEKVGRHIADVHAVVPHYQRELAAKVDGFLDRLRPGVVAARRNWSIHETGERFEPRCPPTLGVSPPDQWLRSEHQTLRRLPSSGAVLFTIRVDQVQLGRLPVAVRHRLAARLEAEPDDLLEYRNLTARRRELVAWLRSAEGCRAEEHHKPPTNEGG